MYRKDKRIVLTLDAGGTNLVFGAMKGCEFITCPFTYPTNSEDLTLCLATIKKGFNEVISKIHSNPVAISFAFPGPADYPNGIIGGYLPNFPSFRHGVPLGHILEKEFGIPVFINNDGDLFTYGEAICGVLPEINRRLKEAGSIKQYRNLIGYTFGTGLGIGMVINNQLNVGDNSCVETFCLPLKDKEEIIAEEGISIRAIKRYYKENAENFIEDLEPKDIYEIAIGEKQGDRKAAIYSFEKFGELAGNSIAITAQLIDGLIVIGGGLSASHKLFMPSLLKELRSQLQTLNGEKVNRLQMEVFYLDEEKDFEKFAQGNLKVLKIPDSDKTVNYDDMKRIGITISKMGASKAISVGAYAFALNKIDSSL